MLASTQRTALAATRRSMHTMATRTAGATRSHTLLTAAAAASISLRSSPIAAPAARRSAVLPSALPARASSHSAKSSPEPIAFVCGGNGALGKAMIASFKQAGWKTICMDFAVNPASDVNITLSSDKDWKANVAFAEEKLHQVARAKGDKGKKHAPVSVMIHCAGSWMGGGVDSLLTTVDPMLDINLKSAISTAYLAGKFLDDSGSGLLLLTGAAAAANQAPTGGMLAYGMSKAATHSLATSLAHKDAGLTKATVVCVLPSMIDTPSNRSMSSNVADYENWTPPAEFAALTLAFAQQLQPLEKGKAAAKPQVQHTHAPLQNGGFYSFTTLKGKTSIKLLPPVFVPEQ